MTGLNNITFYYRKRKRGMVLKWAAIYNYIFILNSFLKKSKVNIYLRDPYGNTLLYLLAGQRKVVLIKLLLEAETNISENNISSFMLLHFATR